MLRSAPLLVVVILLGGCSSDADGPALGTSVADDPAGDEPSTGNEPPPSGDEPPAADDPPLTPGPMLTLDTQEAMLEEVFRIYSGEAWDPTPLRLSDFGALYEAPDTPVTLENGASALIGTARCRSGVGRLELELADSPANFPWRARLDACALDDPERTALALVSGRVEGVWNRDTSARSDDLAWTTASGNEVSFSGEMLVRPEESMFDTLESFVTTNARQVLRGGDDDMPPFSIEEATSRERFGAIGLIEDIASLSGGFVYRSALTGGRAVTVRTPLELTYRWDARTPAPDGVAPEAFSDVPLGDLSTGTEARTAEQWAAVGEARARWVFTAGMLELQAEDGSRLLLDADTGEFDTVRITLDTGRGDGAEEHVVDWPRSWYRALAFDTRQMTRAGGTR